MLSNPGTSYNTVDVTSFNIKNNMDTLDLLKPPQRELNSCQSSVRMRPEYTRALTRTLSDQLIFIMRGSLKICSCFASCFQDESFFFVPVPGPTLRICTLLKI